MYVFAGIGLFFLLLPGGGEGRDTSRRSTFVHPRRFVPLRQVPTGGVSLLSPNADWVARYVGAGIVLTPLNRGGKSVSLLGHRQNIHDGGWSRNGKVLVTGAYDGVVKAWDVDRAKEIASIQAHAGYA